MAISNDLLNILVCPACRQKVELKGEFIVCTGCKKRYPIRDDIPIMLVNEALEPEAEKK